MGEDEKNIGLTWDEELFSQYFYSPSTTYVPYTQIEHSLQFLEPKDINNPKAMFDKINEIIGYIRRSR